MLRALAGQRLVPGPLDGVGAGQLAGQRRVEVDDAVGEPAEEAHREDAHPAGEHDEVGAEAGDDVGEAGVVVGAGLAGVAADVDGGHAGGAGPLEGVGVGAVGHDGDDLGGSVPVGAGVEDGLQVRPVAGRQHDEAGRRSGLHPDPAWFDARRTAGRPSGWTRERKVSAAVPVSVGGMAVYLCHEFPDLYEHDADGASTPVPGRVVLDRSAFHPGGGGQVSDIGWLESRRRRGADRRRRDVVDGVDVARARRRRRRAVRARRPCASTPSTGRASPSCTPTRTSSTPSSTSASPARSSPARRSTPTAPGAWTSTCRRSTTTCCAASTPASTTSSRRGVEVRSVYVDAGDAEPRRRARPQPVGRPAADARRAAAGHRDRRRRPPGLRRHAPVEHRPVAAVRASPRSRARASATAASASCSS